MRTATALAGQGSLFDSPQARTRALGERTPWQLGSPRLQSPKFGMDDSIETAPEERPARGRRGAASEVALVYVGVSAVIWTITRLRDVPPYADYVHLAVGGLFLAGALKLAGRQPAGTEGYGLALGGLLDASTDETRSPGPLGLFDLGRALLRATPPALRELGFALVVAALIFPPFVAGFYLWHAPHHAFAFQPPIDPASFVLAQFVVVALPEEAFFRGYLQTRLGDVFARKVRVLGADLNLGAWFLSAALFGLIHFIVEGQVTRLAVFFPGLLFGWARARRGGIGAGLALHAMSNVLAEVLVRGWL